MIAPLHKEGIMPRGIPNKTATKSKAKTKTRAAAKPAARKTKAMKRGPGRPKTKR